MIKAAVMQHFKTHILQSWAKIYMYINSLMKIQPTILRYHLFPPGLNFIDSTRQLNGKLAA